MWRWFAIRTLCTAAPCTTKWCFVLPRLHFSLGLPTLRFNFRGAGKSVGTFTGGDGEREDVRAALDYLAAHFPGLPVCLMGFSFGAWVGLEVGATDARVSTLVGLGVPVNIVNFDFLRDVRKPKLILQGTRDEFGSVAQVSELYRLACRAQTDSLGPGR